MAMLRRSLSFANIFSTLCRFLISGFAAFDGAVAIFSRRDTAFDVQVIQSRAKGGAVIAIVRDRSIGDGKTGDMMAEPLWSLIRPSVNNITSGQYHQ